MKMAASIEPNSLLLNHPARRVGKETVVHNISIGLQMSSEILQELLLAPLVLSSWQVCNRKSPPGDPRVSDVRPDAAFARLRQFPVQHLLPGYRRFPPPSTPAQNPSSFLYKGSSKSAHCRIQPHIVRSLSSTPKRRKIFACLCSEKMIGVFRHDHLRQQARARIALFDRLRRLGRCLYRAGARVLFADAFDHDQLCRNVLIALAALFAELAQILRTEGAMLSRSSRSCTMRSRFRWPGKSASATRSCFGAEGLRQEGLCQSGPFPASLPFDRSSTFTP